MNPCNSLACAFLALLLPCSLGSNLPAQGGKGGGGGTPAGTVYFTFQGGTWKMNADGSAKAELPGIRGEPSHTLHGGLRWWLEVQVGELLARSEDGASLVPLTDPGDGVTVLDPGFNGGAVRWAKDDSFVSYVGTDVTAQRAIVRTQLAWSGSGAPSPGAVDLPLVAGDVPAGTVLWAFDWAPDARNLVLEVRDQGFEHVETHQFLRVKDTTTAPGVSTALASGSQGHWAPDGSRIVFRGNRSIDDIYTILPNGTGSTIILQGQGGGPQATTVDSPRWAPTSQHLAYHRGPWSAFGGARSDVYRATASGGSKTNLTSGLTTAARMGAYPIAWR